MEADNSNVRIAVLIDADNTSHKYAEALLDEVAKYGNPTVLRAYGDWSSEHLKGWRRQLNLRGIRPIHQVAWTTGKNSTDFVLVIDAMDLLYSGNVEAFALVASDSDYTGLAQRLRESGKKVYGFGRKTTAAALQNSCDEFIQLEVLGEDNEDDSSDAEEAPKINLQSALTRAVNARADDNGWVPVSLLGQQVKRTHPSFDARNFGEDGERPPTFTQLVESQGYLETQRDGGQVKVRLKGQSPARKTAARKSPAKKAAPKRE